MKKFLGILLTAGVLSLPAFGMGAEAAATWVGVVDGKGGYEIVQATDTMTPGAGQMARLMVGDRVIAGAEPVTIRLADNGTVLVGSNSEVSMVQERIVRLQSGTVAAGFQSGNPMSVEYDTIDFSTVQPLAEEGETEVVPTAGEAKSAVLAVEQLGPQTIRLSALNEMAVVKDIKTGAQLAVVGANDTLEMVLNEAGKWMPGTRGLQPLAQQDAAQTTAPAASSGGGGGGGSAVGLAGVGVGVAGLGVGIYGLNKSSNLEDDVHKLRKELNDLDASDLIP
ncbi:MAG: hypothetical protein PWP23_1234 [Candidatus Sumerlaeota bacterium]|nr:hypothetical protein [Candidatus Sumerlaeota bacterium]